MSTICSCVCVWSISVSSCRCNPVNTDGIFWAFGELLCLPCPFKSIMNDWVRYSQHIFPKLKDRRIRNENDSRCGDKKHFIMHLTKTFINYISSSRLYIIKGNCICTVFAWEFCWINTWLQSPWLIHEKSHLVWKTWDMSWCFLWSFHSDEMYIQLQRHK